MDEFIIKVIESSPLLGIVVYIIYLANSTGKEILQTLQRMEVKLDHLCREKGFEQDTTY